MWTDYLMIISREPGTENFKNIPLRIAYIVQENAVENGSNLPIYTKRMGRNLVSVVVVRLKFAVFVTENGTERKTAPRMRKQTSCWRRQKRLVGRDVTIVGQWLS